MHLSMFSKCTSIGMYQIESEIMAYFLLELPIIKILMHFGSLFSICLKCSFLKLFMLLHMAYDMCFGDDKKWFAKLWIIQRCLMYANRIWVLHLWKHVFGRHNWHYPINSLLLCTFLPKLLVSNGISYRKYKLKKNDLISLNYNL